MLDRKPYTIEHIAPLAETDSRRAKKLTIRSAHDLRRREFPAIRYVVPGYIAEGCTILAGRPKLQGSQPPSQADRASGCRSKRKHSQPTLLFDCRPHVLKRRKIIEEITRHTALR